jgi:DNA-binding CsgD family transcriptional regulator
MDFWSYIIEESKLASKKGRAESMHTKCSIRRKYPLGKLFPGRHLTYREAQCMQLLVNGSTMKAIGKALSLSPRTVEYYLNNVKRKLSCRSKRELINLMIAHQYLWKFAQPKYMH